MGQWPGITTSAMTLGAAAWPLAAGLSLVVWSKMRARPNDFCGPALTAIPVLVAAANRR